MLLTHVEHFKYYTILLDYILLQVCRVRMNFTIQLNDMNELIDTDGQY